MTYGTAPVALGRFDPEWEEFMHYLYLPVRFKAESEPAQYVTEAFALPPRIKFLLPVLAAVGADAFFESGFHDPYVYVTARRGYATPDNPLNRPGWHCDGFGTSDLNYVWWDRWGSRFAVHPFTDVDPGHAESMRNFADQINPGRVRVGHDRTLYRLDPYCVHTTPNIPAPGGMRSFLKISVSNHRYNLVGNSHNHLLDYDWQMHPRDVARNDPAYGGADYIPAGTE